MNDTSMTARLTRFGQRDVILSVRIQARRVGALHGDDPRIGAQRIGQLSAAHVESIDARRAAAQQQSVKPPVDAPTSRQTRPATSMRNASSAAASFSPPRDTNGARSASANGARLADKLTGFHVAARAVARAYADLAGQEQTRGHVAVRSQSALDEQIVEPDARVRRVRAQAVRASIVDEARWCARRDAQLSDRLAHLLGDAGHVDAQVAPQVTHRAVVDEVVRRQADDLDRSRAATRRRTRRPRVPRARPEPKPPATTLSSSVTTSFLPRACRRIVSRRAAWRSAR